MYVMYNEVIRDNGYVFISNQNNNNNKSLNNN